jgi:hypothetical protein
MTLQHRAAAYAAAFAKWPAGWPTLVQEQGRDVLYATWLLGNNYRNASRFYGSYPPGYVDRVMALFPDVREKRPLNDGVLHVFSGSLPDGPYTRLDCNPTLTPDIVGSVYDVATLLKGYHWPLVLADPPYSSADAVHYETAMVDRRRALAALAQVTRVGGHLVWLDVCWPMHRKREWVTVGRITIVRSTNHRVRMATIFERAA